MAKKNKGFSAMEMIVVVAIVGTVVLLGRVAILLINDMMQASAVAKVQQEAQMTLYTVTKDIRNSTRIVFASSTTLKLNVINPSLGYDVRVNQTLFDPINVATLTYHYMQVGNESYMRKTIERNQVLVEDRKLLRNVLLTPDTTKYMFNICDRGGVLLDECPLPGTSGYPPDPSQYYGVDVRFRMSPSFTRNANVQYTAKEIKRAGVQ